MKFSNIGRNMINLYYKN